MTKMVEKIRRRELPVRAGRVKFYKCVKCGYILFSDDDTCAHCLPGTVTLELIDRAVWWIEFFNVTGG